MSTDAVGGVWTYATSLRDALAAEGVEVVLAALGPAAPPQDIPYLPCALEWQPEPWADVQRSGRWLRDLAEEAGTDVIHLNGYAHAAGTWPAPTVVVAHSCVLSWHAAVRGRSAGPEWERYRREVRAGLLAADVVVAPTHAMLAAIRRHYDLGDRGCVIHNGAAAGPAPSPMRERVVLGAGRLWDEAKGLDTLDAAAGELPWPVHIAGDAKGVRARYAELLGALPHDTLRRRMARAAIFAHPARYEPFGLGILEAALGGCAPVLGDIDSLRELWDGSAAFVAPDDAEALRHRLQALIDDGAERDALAARAAARAEALHVTRTARAYARLYTRLQTPMEVAL
jgi:glycogen(starch) synthase